MSEEIIILLKKHIELLEIENQMLTERNEYLTQALEKHCQNLEGYVNKALLIIDKMGKTAELDREVIK